MNRRNFLSYVGLGVLAAAFVPASLSAIDFRSTMPKVWSATKVDAAVKELFGAATPTQGSVKLKAPDIAENGLVVPITVESDLDAKTVAIFQDANPESTVAVFTVPENGIVDYDIRIKMAKTGTVSVVVETKDGKLYTDSKLVKVTKGGCGG
jgi:sulfur-oxidizing protein SoxY